MAIPVQKMREIVFLLLYSQDLADQSAEELRNLLSKELKVSKSVVKEAQSRADQIKKRLPTIDQEISGIVISYRFERIPSVERNILRLGIFELLFDELIPPKVAIAESIRLTRKFSSPEAAHFINAVLDALFKKKQGKEAESSLIEKAAQSLNEKEQETQDLLERAKEHD